MPVFRDHSVGRCFGLDPHCQFGNYHAAGAASAVLFSGSQK